MHKTTQAVLHACVADISAAGGRSISGLRRARAYHEQDDRQKPCEESNVRDMSVTPHTRIVAAPQEIIPKGCGSIEGVTMGDLFPNVEIRRGC